MEEIQVFVCAFQGSDQRNNSSLNTNYSVRGKLQNRRCKLNKEINKELRLRAGAENLYRVSRRCYFLDFLFAHNNFIISSFVISTDVWLYSLVARKNWIEIH